MLNSNQNSNGTGAVSKVPQQLAAKMSQPCTLNIGVHLFYSRLLGREPTKDDAKHQKAVLDTLRLLDKKALQRTIFLIHTQKGVEQTSQILKEAGIEAENSKCIVSPLGELDDERYVYTFQSKGLHSAEKFVSSPQIWTGFERVILFGGTEDCVGNARSSLLALQKEKGRFEIEVPIELFLFKSQYWG